MKEIKAFVRSEKADKIVEAMEDLGISDITLVEKVVKIYTATVNF